MDNIAPPGLTQSALDFEGLGKLRAQARQDDKAAVRETAQQFEALFIQMMMKSMREAVVKDEDNVSQAGDMYQDLMDRELSVQFAKRRTFGIADMLTKQLQNQAPVSTQALLEGRQAAPVAHPLKPEAIKAYKLGSPADQGTPAVGLPQQKALPLNSSGVLPIQEVKSNEGTKS